MTDALPEVTPPPSARPGHPGTLTSLTHAGFSLIAGLRWSLVNGKASQARAFARTQDADHLVCMPQGSARLTGVAHLGRAGPPARKRPASLALTLLPALGHNGWGLFPLDNGEAWFVACVNGQLSVLSDQTGPPDRLRERVRTFLQFNPTPPGGWQLCCPEPAWLTGLEGGVSHDNSGAVDTRPLRDVLATLPVPRSARLRPVSGRKTWLRAAALIALGALGYLTWQHHQTQTLLAGQAAARAAIQARHHGKARPQARPWTSLPTAQDFTAQCARVWHRAPLSIAGWVFETAECSQHGLRLAWKKPDGGTLADFSQRLQAWYPHQAASAFFNVLSGANTGGIALPLHMTAAGENDPPGSTDGAVSQLTSTAQRLHMTLTLAKEAGAPVLKNGNKVPPDWHSYRFTLRTDIPPDRLFAPDRVHPAGLRLTRIVLTLAPGTARLSYLLEGKLYVRP